MKKIGILFLLILTLSSCNFLPSSEGGLLLKAPMMNQVQKEVNDALSETVDVGEIIYKYPQSGEHRSPFVFFDLDGDGEEEALVFYATKDAPNQTRIKVLRQEDKGWTTFWDMAGRSPRVDFVDFSPLFGAPGSSLVIGWGGSSSKMVTVHNMTEDAMEQKLEEYYHAYYLKSYPAEETSELVLVQQDSADASFYLTLYGTSGQRLRQLDSVPLFEETTDVIQLLPGKLYGGDTALYIDEEQGISYATEIVKIKPGTLEKLVGSETGPKEDSDTQRWDNYADTFRLSPYLCEDLEADGIVEVPRPRDLHDMAEVDTDQQHSINLLEYLQFNGESFQVAFVAAINEEAGYMLYFPDRWVGNVTIEKDPQRQIWRVSRIDPNSGEPTIELFRVQRYHASDYKDEFRKDDILLGTRGVYSYYGTIPETGGDPLAITPEEAKNEIFAIR